MAIAASAGGAGGTANHKPDKTAEELIAEADKKALKEGKSVYGCCISSSVSVPFDELKSAFDELDVEGDGSIGYDKMKFLIVGKLGMEDKVYDEILQRNVAKDTEGTQHIEWDDLKAEITTMAMSRKLTLPEMIFKTFDDPSSSVTANMISTVILILILISSVCFVLETSPSMTKPDYADNHRPVVAYRLFATIEIIATSCFTIEYLGRLLTVWAVRPDIAAQKEDDGEPPDDDAADVLLEVPSGWTKTVNFFMEPMNLIDFAAIFPFYLELALGSTGIKLAVLRILRVMRVFRMFKLGKYNTGLMLFMKTFVSAGPALILLTFFFVLDVVVFGALLYFAEGGEWHGPHQVCPNTGGNGGLQWLSNHMDANKTLLGRASTCAEAGFSEGAFLRFDVSGTMHEPTPFLSILHSMWCIVTTATTVGYGDVYPTSPGGKLIATMSVLCGLIVLALPITVIGSNFQEHYNAVSKKNREARVLRQAQFEAKKRARQMRNKQKELTAGGEGAGAAAAEADATSDMALLLSDFAQELQASQKRMTEMQEHFGLIMKMMEKAGGAEGAMAPPKLSPRRSSVSQVQVQVQVAEPVTAAI